LWPLAAIELKALKANSFSHRVSLFLERFIYQKANLILGQSHEIITHIHAIFPDKKCYLYRNFPDHKTVEIDLETKENEPIKVFYAGLFGVAQGVFELCQKMSLKGLNIELHLFGDGAEKSQIEALIHARTDKKIFFYGMMERNDLHKILKTFDLTIIPLKTRIYGSVPSKIFEYSTFGFPVLYFGGGEGEIITEQHQLGWVAKVGDYGDLNKRLQIIANIPKKDLDIMKKRIFKEAQTSFNLDAQIKYLIAKNVF
jgi:glycosyltransferase involved in cell wall biosynthesis